MMNNTVLVNVASINIDSMEGYLKGHLTKLAELLGKVPEEFRDSVEISYDTYEDCPYDNTYNTVMLLSYYRPETPEETSARVESDKGMHKERRAKKMVEYEKLKKELGLC